MLLPDDEFPDEPLPDELPPVADELPDEVFAPDVPAATFSVFPSLTVIIPFAADVLPVVFTLSALPRIMILPVTFTLSSFIFSAPSAIMRSPFTVRPLSDTPLSRTTAFPLTVLDSVPFLSIYDEARLFMSFANSARVMLLLGFIFPFEPLT